MISRAKFILLISVLAITIVASGLIGVIINPENNYFSPIGKIVFPLLILILYVKILTYLHKKWYPRIIKLFENKKNDST